MMGSVLQYSLAATPTTDALQHLIDSLQEKTEGRVVVADLTLGSWTAHSLAMQLLGQLRGKELRTRRWQPDKEPVPGRSNPNIDEDARGNSVVRMAHALAVRIRRTLKERPTSALVLVPCFGQTWRTEDRLLLEYLQTRCLTLQITLGCIDAVSACLPAEWQVTCLQQETGSVLTERGSTNSMFASLPGALSPRHGHLLKRATALEIISLPNTWALIRPEDRLAAGLQQYLFRHEDLMILRTIGFGEFIPFALLHGACSHDGGMLLRDEAWTQFAAGGRDLALQMMEMASNCPENLHTRAITIANYKKMLVSMARYADASVATPLLLEDLSAQDRRFLLEWQGWALVMNGQAQESRACLSEALSLADFTCEDAEHLFLMNITALSEVRCGNHKRAYELEKRIEMVLGSEQYPDEGMIYINCLNLARLFRYAKDWKNAELYYRKAFATAEGAPSETDRVNEELCRARLAEDQGRWCQAFHFTFRAALYWLASDCPEAMTWRVQNLIVGSRAFKTISHFGEVNECVEQLALGFQTMLQRLGKAAGLEDYGTCHTTAINFCWHDDDSPVSDGMVYLGGPHWAVISDPLSEVGCEYGPHFHTLKWYVATRIAKFHGLDGINTIRVARNDGRSMPSTKDAMLHQATSLAIRAISFGETLVQLSSREPESSQLLQRSHLVQRSEIDADGTTVFFRRYLAPCRLTLDEAAVLEETKEAVYLKDLYERFGHLGLQLQDGKQIVRALRRKSILAVHHRSEDNNPTNVFVL